MCGIIGYVGEKNNAISFIMEGLRNLEYRGYDSAGIAYKKNNKLEIIKEEGKLLNLMNKLDLDFDSSIGIGHTRWATHGVPNKTNSHPHQVGKITLVHNGIIENAEELKKELCVTTKFNTETDSEVACALINSIYNDTNDMLKTLKIVKERLVGSYALGIICEDDLDHLYAIKKESPLIIGLGTNENYIASDVPAILKYTNKYIALEDMDYGIISKNEVVVFDKHNEKRKIVEKIFQGSSFDLEKGGYEHFMLKEINEEASVTRKLIKKYVNDDIEHFLKEIPDITKYKNIKIVACGSAMHAGLVGKSLIEKFVNIPVEVVIASEFRYSRLFVDKETLVIPISQSGETADTLAALKIARESKAHTIGIINVKESSIAREADEVMYIEAGTEVAVATTKAYSAQVFVLSLLALANAYRQSTISKEELATLIKEMDKLPGIIDKIVKDDIYIDIAKKIYDHNDIFFIGRKVDYALCMEGSLKLKEISYLHSEAYAAGELKHGTISLIEEGTPVFGIVTDDEIADKTISNIKEVAARGAFVIYLTNKNTEDFASINILINKVSEFFEPLLAIIPLQIIAYEVAKFRKCDIDKPKNLAKSVTVE